MNQNNFYFQPFPPLPLNLHISKVSLSPLRAPSRNTLYSAAEGIGFHYLPYQHYLTPGTYQMILYNLTKCYLTQYATLVMWYGQQPFLLFHTLFRFKWGFFEFSFVWLLVQYQPNPNLFCLCLSNIHLILEKPHILLQKMWHFGICDYFLTLLPTAQLFLWVNLTVLLRNIFS